ncbi:hypothetical protein [Aurantimonas sp. VKM B-3413]|uniref:hypothetical protein n=1 Tax=Aurantimonas sp. VKM B-3413 TaxID=2779401 RepID=UPI001E4217E4|nr:hypothetical protein [Aurantimonas sp. VKM B-3413]MCB8840166.1 hypothetical protein [Aurantimonas sp. VKM B-3413]
MDRLKRDRGTSSRSLNRLTKDSRPLAEHAPAGPDARQVPIDRKPVAPDQFGSAKSRSFSAQIDNPLRTDDFSREPIMANDLDILILRCKEAAETDEALARDLRAALAEHVRPVETAADASRALASTDGAIELAVKALPGWNLQLDGTTLGGAQWSCILREGRDDEETVGAGLGATPAIAINAAILGVIRGFEGGFK